MKTLNTILMISFFVGTAVANMGKKSHPARFPQNQNQMMMYQVQPGDHLAEILRSMGLEPLWGPQGSVQRTIELNKLQTPNQLTHGMWLKIPADRPMNMENYEMDQGVARKKSSTVDVYCPDGSVQTAQIYMVPARPGRPAKVVFLNSAKAVCSETAMKAAPIPPPVVPAAPSVTDLPAQDPDAMDDLDVQLKPATEAQQTQLAPQPTPPPAAPQPAAPQPAAPQPAAPPPAQVPQEAVKKEEALAAPPAEEKKVPAEDYFADDRTSWDWQAGPLIGYGSNRFEVNSSHFTMNKGFNYGARLEGSWGTTNDRLLLGANYLSASLVNSGVSSDKSTVTMTSYGLGYEHKSWSYRVGMINNAVKNTLGVNAVNFNGTGTYFSIAHDWKISLKWTFGYELRYVAATYKASSNSSLQNDMKGTQIESILGFQYRWGANK